MQPQSNGYALQPGSEIPKPTVQSGPSTPMGTVMASDSPSDMQKGFDEMASLSSSTDGIKVLGSMRPRPKKKWTNRFVKLMVIGDSGLGKTTLVRSLLAVPGEKMKLHDGSETNFRTFQKDPDSCLSSITWDNAEDCVHWTYQIQDTPGYGDDLNVENNINRIKMYLEKQNERWQRMETNANREDLAIAVDPRVDICIFALPPHRVRNIDLLFMWEISQMVPLLPVVTKSDTMTIRECVAYRTEVNQKLMHPGLVGRRGPIKLFAFDRETLNAVGCPDNAMAQAMRPPYLVVCSNDYNVERMNQPEPELWPERRYMWGTSEAFNQQHSDLLLLRRLLLSEGVEEICDSKIDRYEEWRTRNMRQIRPLRTIGVVCAKAILTVAVILGGLQLSGLVDVKKEARSIGSATEAKVEEVVAVVVEKADEVGDAVASLVTPEEEETRVLVDEPKQSFWFGRK